MPMATLPAKQFALSVCRQAAILMAGAALVLSTQAVELTATPAAVQAVIHARLGRGQLDAIDATNDAGETTFDVSFTTQSGEDAGFTVAEDGTVLSVEVALAATPAAVQKTIRERATGWQLEDLSQDLTEMETSYDVEVSTNARETSFTVASDGALLSAEVTLAETPPAVQTTIKSQVANGTCQSISEEFDPAGNSFDVDARTTAGGRDSFTVGMDGTLQSVEVSLEKVPPAARKTIRNKMGDGKILQIEKSLVEKKDGVLPYEVEGRKDGRPFNFSVGPHGRFLGMDEN